MLFYENALNQCNQSKGKPLIVNLIVPNLFVYYICKRKTNLGSFQWTGQRNVKSFFLIGKGMLNKLILVHGLLLIWYVVENCNLMI